jgi:hypothetical protein
MISQSYESFGSMDKKFNNNFDDCFILTHHLLGEIRYSGKFRGV